MRIASLLSIFTSASAPAMPGNSFDVVLQAAISDAMQRQGGNGSAGYDAQPPVPAAAAAGAAGDQEDETAVVANTAAPAGEAVGAATTDPSANGVPASMEVTAPAQPTAIATTLAPIAVSELGSFGQAIVQRATAARYDLPQQQRVEVEPVATGVAIVAAPAASLGVVRFDAAESVGRAVAGTPREMVAMVPSATQQVGSADVGQNAGAVLPVVAWKPGDSARGAAIGRSTGGAEIARSAVSPVQASAWVASAERVNTVPQTIAGSAAATTPMSAKEGPVETAASAPDRGQAAQAVVRVVSPGGNVVGRVSAAGGWVTRTAAPAVRVGSAVDVAVPTMFYGSTRMPLAQSVPVVPAIPAPVANIEAGAAGIQVPAAEVAQRKIAKYFDADSAKAYASGQQMTVAATATPAAATPSGSFGEGTVRGASAAGQDGPQQVEREATGAATVAAMEARPAARPAVSWVANLGSVQLDVAALDVRAVADITREIAPAVPSAVPQTKSAAGQVAAAATFPVIAGEPSQSGLHQSGAAAHEAPSPASHQAAIASPAQPGQRLVQDAVVVKEAAPEAVASDAPVKAVVDPAAAKNDAPVFAEAGEVQSSGAAAVASQHLRAAVETASTVAIPPGQTRSAPASGARVDGIARRAAGSLAAATTPVVLDTAGLTAAATPMPTKNLATAATAAGDAAGWSQVAPAAIAAVAIHEKTASRMTLASPVAAAQAQSAPLVSIPQTLPPEASVPADNAVVPAVSTLQAMPAEASVPVVSNVTMPVNGLEPEVPTVASPAARTQSESSFSWSAGGGGIPVNARPAVEPSATPMRGDDASGAGAVIPAVSTLQAMPVGLSVPAASKAAILAIGLEPELPTVPSPAERTQSESSFSWGAGDGIPADAQPAIELSAVPSHGDDAVPAGAVVPGAGRAAWQGAAAAPAQSRVDAASGGPAIAESSQTFRVVPSGDASFVVRDLPWQGAVLRVDPRPTEATPVDATAAQGVAPSAVSPDNRGEGAEAAVVAQVARIAPVAQVAPIAQAARIATIAQTEPIAQAAPIAQATPIAEPVAKVRAAPVADGGHGAVAPATAPAAQTATAGVRPEAAMDAPATPAIVQPVGAATAQLMPVGLPVEVLNASVDLDVAAAPTDGSGQVGVTPEQRNTSRAAGSGVPAVSSAGGAVRSKDASSSGPSDAAARNAQSGGQADAHASADSPASAPSAATVTSGQVAQMQSVPAHELSHAAASTARMTDAAAETSHETSREAGLRGDPATLHSEIDEAAPASGSGIHAASVIQAMGGTEMRLGMRSVEFGDISIRTSVTPQQMVTQISVDHSDLSQAISAHASSVQARFQNEYGMQASIEVGRQGVASSGEPGGSAQREQQGFVGSVRGEDTMAADEGEIDLGQLAMAGAGEGHRLDIRA